jgi:polyhydroxyalkanoate synthesis regulator phasin
VGNKCPPIGFHWPKGKSGNPSGRPKKKKTFDEILMKEIHKTAKFSIGGGKAVTKSYLEAHISQMVKDGIMKGPQSKKHLSQLLREAEIRLAEEKAKGRSMKYMEEREFNWTEAQETLFQELHDVEAAQRAADLK